ncbi:MAG TPA: HD domain-containing protein [Chthonomonadaceae bacterium]|nr:HD domain-containing protein [Chthonomonadaceae bacterium]
MLPNHPLFSEAGAFDDPHLQWARLTGRTPKADRDRLEASFRLALRLHAAHARSSAQQPGSVTSMSHVVRSGCILALEWDVPEPEAIATALLHDSLEECAQSEQSAIAAEIEQTAGPDVSQAVWKLTRFSLPEAVPAETRGRRDAEYFRGIRTAARWVRLVKCAVRLDSLRDAVMRSDRAAWRAAGVETMGWHLYLARETSAIAEASLFAALVDGERYFNGAVPVWADGHLVDPDAARSVPEHIALAHEVVGVAVRGASLVVGTTRPLDTPLLADIRSAINAGGYDFQSIEPIEISTGALEDVLAARYRHAQ